MAWLPTGHPRRLCPDGYGDPDVEDDDWDDEDDEDEDDDGEDDEPDEETWQVVAEVRSAG